MGDFMMHVFIKWQLKTSCRAPLLGEIIVPLAMELPLHCKDLGPSHTATVYWQCVLTCSFYHDLCVFYLGVMFLCMVVMCFFSRL